MKKYNVISCASFGSSGSGVVTDYLKEYECIKNLGDYEFRFLQDYDGIETLENALIHSPHRLNSDIAIQNYKRYVDRQCGNIFNRRYEKFFNGKWKQISDEFIRKIVDVEWPGYWEQYQIMEPNKLSAFIKYQLYPRILQFLSGKKKYIAHYLPTRTMYFAFPSEDFFIDCVKEYIQNLCNVVDPDNNFRYLYFDQLMPPANISKYERYIESIKTIVVDRDPRDYYIENVMHWGEKWIPSSIKDFACLYKKQREQATKFTDSSNVLRIRFEDTIFNYNEFEIKTQKFLQLEDTDHTFPKKFFNPEISINNTQIWTKQKGYEEIVKTIENLLPEYLYNFDDNNIKV